MMKTPPLLRLLCPAALVVLCLLAQPAWSVTIDASYIINGSAHIRDDVDGFDLYANGGTFLTSDLNGWNGFFGVHHENDIVAEEVDIFGENIVITFDMPHVIQAIEVGRLFAANQYGDKTEEAVQIIAELDDEASDLVELLEVIDPTSASWTGSGGVVTNLSPGERGEAGVWQILDPFDGRPVRSLTFNPYEWPGIRPQDGGQNSDFALLTITAVPEPQTAAFFALGLTGLAVMGRRKRN